MNSKSTSASQELTQFLNTFDAIGLGEGDINAGVHTLATMLCTLANVARPGSGILSPDKKITPVGTNLLASGSLSSSIITDDVLNPLRLNQNNLTAQLERVRSMKEKQDQAGPPRTQSFLERPTKNQSQGALLGLLGDSHGSTSSTAQNWAMVAHTPPNPDFENLTSNTKIVVSASTATELERQLQDTHQGRPLVLLGLSRASGTERMANLCSALMDGRLADGEGGKTVRGNLIITDANAGPEVPGLGDMRSPLADISQKYSSAVARAFGKRLDHKTTYSTLHELDIRDAQLRWGVFLQSMEQSLPGISGAARTLLATLVFGALELLTSPGQQAKDVTRSLKGIEAFARFLVRRMANYRNVITYSAKQERNDELKIGILRKLEDGPHTVRELTRRFSRLTAEPCRKLLNELREAGKVRVSDGEWQLSEPVPSPLTLEI